MGAVDARPRRGRRARARAHARTRAAVPSRVEQPRRSACARAPTYARSGPVESPPPRQPRIDKLAPPMASDPVNATPDTELEQAAWELEPLVEGEGDAGV